MLAGQHTVAAVGLIRDELMGASMPLPPWCVKFRCHRIKPSTSLSDRRLIAGRQQARSALQQSVPLSTKVDWFLKIHHQRLQSALDIGSTAAVDKTSVLNTVYLQCGCSDAVEGSPVCNP